MKYPDSEEFLIQVGKQLKSLRKKQNLTQLDVAVRAGLEENAIQRIETGRINSTLKTILKVANALEIEVYKLLVFSDDNIE